MCGSWDRCSGVLDTVGIDGPRERRGRFSPSGLNKTSSDGSLVKKSWIWPVCSPRSDQESSARNTSVLRSTTNPRNTETSFSFFTNEISPRTWAGLARSFGGLRPAPKRNPGKRSGMIALKASLSGSLYSRRTSFLIAGARSRSPSLLHRQLLFEIQGVNAGRAASLHVARTGCTVRAESTGGQGWLRQRARRCDWFRSRSG